MKISTHWLKDYVKWSPPVEKVAEKLTMAGLEVEKVIAMPGGDSIFEIEITSNRPDWLSHIGVAREISAIDNLGLKLPDIELPSKRPLPKGWKLNLKEKEGCPYYTGVYVEGITETKTPAFIKERLEACGLRSISLLVDITNYVLLETGQPLHAFDADILKGKEIQIRRAKNKEKMTMIDGTALELSADDLVIADGEVPVALAGVMGGKDSEINERTRNVFLESAFFHPRWVRKTSLRHSIKSDSSYRFERRVDPEGVDFGRDRALSLIIKYGKPRLVSGLLKMGQKPVTFRGKIHLASAEIEKRLGVGIKPSTTASILTRLGLEVKPDAKDAWNVGVPSFRSDLTRPIDLIEEVARVYGFDKIPDTLPISETQAVKQNPIVKIEDKTRDYFTGVGGFETITFSLISSKGLSEDEELKDAMCIVNPQHKELKWMRPTMLTSLLDVVHNNDRQGTKDLLIYEIANLYTPSKGAKDALPNEEKSLAVALTGNRHEKTWLDQERAGSFHDLKGMCLEFLNYLGVSDYELVKSSHSLLDESTVLSIQVGGKNIGYLGEVKQNLIDLWDLKNPVYFAELSLTQLKEEVHWIKPLAELSKFPATHRDLSLVVEESAKAAEIETEILKLGEGLIKKVEVFDLFKGGRIPKGCKNLAFSLTYQSNEKTLVSEDIQELHTKIADSLVKRFQATFQA